MSETGDILSETVHRLFADRVTRKLRDEADQGVWPEALWSALQEVGLPWLAVSEARGGAGADFDDQMAVIRLAGYHAAPVPLAETLLAEHLLAAAGLPAIVGPLTIGPVYRDDRLILSRQGSRWVVDGTLYRVPFARNASAIVAIADHEGERATVVIRPPFALALGIGHDHEPRDTVTLTGYGIADEDVGPIGRGLCRLDLSLHGALERAVQMVGAMQRMLEMTAQYSLDRIQFGRPIAKFQAVQHQIAMLASHAAAASAAVRGAISAAREHPALFETAAAKARAGEAAALVIEYAHQVHGAIGFTRDHSLHFWTRRLWTWRDEFGNEADWNAQIGYAVTQVGGEALWTFLTAAEKNMAYVPQPLV
jgi:alkylation response protein AidB-like acyl-CoA dehydrogenase